MNFATPQAVYDAISAGDDVRRVRSENRALVNNAANGMPPLSEEEAKSANIKVNTNFLEQAEIHAQARRQYLTAYYRTQRFFSMQFGPEVDVPGNNKAKWESYITGFINRKMRKSRDYFELRRSTDANVVAHGIGPCAWFDRHKWCPDDVAIEDLYIATDTKVSFKNLEWFCIRFAYTEGELARRVFGPCSLKGWNKEAVKKILHEYHEDNEEKIDYDWLNAPEKMWELVKQNMGYYISDAVPTIPLFHLWFKDKDEAGLECWKMRVICDTEVKGETALNEEFLFDPSQSFETGKVKKSAVKAEKPSARRLEEILHCQFGDISNKAPFLYHSVRSLGFMLMEPCYWSNLLLCRLIQFTFENFNVWLRSTDPAGKARAQMVNLFDKAFLPSGISIVPNTERHQIDTQTVEMVMARMKQLMAEKSATYTQQSDTGTHKEQTAFETMTKMQQVNAMMESLLTTSFVYENFKYMEICRRFCLTDTEDEDCKEFQTACKKFGIPRQYLNVELWDISPEIPLGGGNPTMGMAKAQALMAARGQFPPPAQQEILHRWTLEMTDPRTAQQWVPVGENKGVDDAQRDAEFSFGTIMSSGVPVQHAYQFSPIEQLEVFLTLLSKVVDDMEKDFSLVNSNSLRGADAAAAYSGSLLQQLTQRPDEKENVKKFGKVQGMIVNALKGLRQRMMEAQKKQQAQPDPAAQAKAQTTLMLGQTKMQIDAAKAAQKLKQNKEKFAAEQKRKGVSTFLDEHRKSVQVVGEEKRKNAMAVGEAKRSRIKSFNDE